MFCRESMFGVAAELESIERRIDDLLRLSYPRMQRSSQEDGAAGELEGEKDPQVQKEQNVLSTLKSASSGARTPSGKGRSLRLVVAQSEANSGVNGQEEDYEGKAQILRELDAAELDERKLFINELVGEVEEFRESMRGFKSSGAERPSESSQEKEDFKNELQLEVEQLLLRKSSGPAEKQLTSQECESCVGVEDRASWNDYDFSDTSQEQEYKEAWKLIREIRGMRTVSAFYPMESATLFINDKDTQEALAAASPQDEIRRKLLHKQLALKERIHMSRAQEVLVRQQIRKVQNNRLQAEQYIDAFAEKLRGLKHEKEPSSAERVPASEE